MSLTDEIKTVCSHLLLEQQSKYVIHRIKLCVILQQNTAVLGRWRRVKSPASVLR